MAALPITHYRNPNAFLHKALDMLAKNQPREAMAGLLELLSQVTKTRRQVDFDRQQLEACSDHVYTVMSRLFASSSPDMADLFASAKSQIADAEQKSAGRTWHDLDTREFGWEHQQVLTQVMSSFKEGGAPALDAFMRQFAGEERRAYRELFGKLKGHEEIMNDVGKYMGTAANFCFTSAFLFLVRSLPLVAEQPIDGAEAAQPRGDNKARKPSVGLPTPLSAQVLASFKAEGLRFTGQLYAKRGNNFGLVAAPKEDPKKTAEENAEIRANAKVWRAPIEATMVHNLGKFRGEDPEDAPTVIKMLRSFHAQFLRVTTFLVLVSTLCR